MILTFRLCVFTTCVSLFVTVQGQDIAGQRQAMMHSIRAPSKALRVRNIVFIHESTSETIRAARHLAGSRSVLNDQAARAALRARHREPATTKAIAITPRATELGSGTASIRAKTPISSPAPPAVR